MNLTKKEMDLLEELTDAMLEKFDDLYKRVKALEARQPVINNYYTYPAIQPAPIWAPNPQYPTWTCKNDTAVPPTTY
jgi:hypothetical protein